MAAADIQDRRSAVWWHAGAHQPAQVGHARRETRDGLRRQRLAAAGDVGAVDALSIFGALRAH